MTDNEENESEMDKARNPRGDVLHSGLSTGIDTKALNRATAEGVSYLGDIDVARAIVSNFVQAIIPFYAQEWTDDAWTAAVEAEMAPYIDPLLGRQTSGYEPVRGWNQDNPDGGLPLRISDTGGVEGTAEELVRFFFWTTASELREIIEGDDTISDEDFNDQMESMIDRRALFLLGVNAGSGLTEGSPTAV